MLNPQEYNLTQLLSILRVKFLRLRTYKMKTQRSYFQNVTIKSDCTAKVTKKKKPTFLFVIMIL